MSASSADEQIRFLYSTIARDLAQPRSVSFAAAARRFAAQFDDPAVELAELASGAMTAYRSLLVTAAAGNEELAGSYTAQVLVLNDVQEIIEGSGAE